MTILGLAGATTLLVAADTVAQDPLSSFSPLDLSAIRAMGVQSDGRWPPLDTVARDAVEQVTGAMDYRGHDPVALLLAWTFDPEPWFDAPLFTIDNAELRRLLELSPDRESFSYRDLVSSHRFMELMSGLRGKSGKAMDPLDRKVADIGNRLGLLSDAFTGELIRPVPHPSDPNGVWQPAGSGPIGRQRGGPVEAEWNAVGEALRAGDAAQFDQAVAAFLQKRDGLPAASRPDPGDLALEVRLNRLRPYYVAFWLMLVATVLAIPNLFIRAGRPRRVLSVLTFVTLLVGFAFVTWGIGARWHLAGRIPAANMYESMLFLAWGVGAFDLIAILVLRQPIVSFKSALVATGALALVNFVGLDWTIRPVMPALLDTAWMAIHVPIIMVSYSVLFDAFVIAHIQLIVLAAAPRHRKRIQSVDQLHYWFLNIGALLLFAGITTGSMWGAYAWGRYWGWDPKEVWSLIAYVAYLAILHVRADRDRMPAWLKIGCVLLVGAMFLKLITLFAPMAPWQWVVMFLAAVGLFIFVIGRGDPLTTAVKSILGAWLIGMTYVGVNYVLGTGLHSYGFGTAETIVTLAMWVGGVDLAFIAVCTALHLWRSGRTDLRGPTRA
jgi:ABC-type transport system involved in cytochrome c biogenesis permease subunit